MVTGVGEVEAMRDGRAEMEEGGGVAFEDVDGGWGGGLQGVKGGEVGGGEAADEGVDCVGGGGGEVADVLEAEAGAGAGYHDGGHCGGGVCLGFKGAVCRDGRPATDTRPGGILWSVSISGSQGGSGAPARLRVTL